MPAARRPASPAISPAPPWYEAAEDLYVSSPDAAAMPVLAYRAGDRIVPDVIDANGWGGKVRVPDVFAGQPSPAPPVSEATAPASQPPGTTGESEEKLWPAATPLQSPSVRAIC